MLSFIARMTFVGKWENAWTLSVFSPLPAVSKKNLFDLRTLNLLFFTMNLLCGECRARSDCTYVQSNLALHSLMFYKWFLLTLYLTCQLWALKIQQQIKIWYQKYGQMGIHFSEWTENIVGKKRNCLLRAIHSFPAMFSKAVCCWCVKMSIYGVKG